MSVITLISIKSAVGDENKEPPTTYLWTLFFLAQYYDHFRKLDIAIQFVKEALDHTPTLIEGYILEGKIYKVCFMFCLSFQIQYRNTYSI